MPFTVPGIGYIGLGSQTRAAQATFSQAMRGRSGNGTRKRRRAASATTRRRRRIPGKSATRSRRGASRPARMVKGSAAAKRHMAKLRRMRKK